VASLSSQKAAALEPKESALTRPHRNHGSGGGVGRGGGSGRGGACGCHVRHVRAPACVSCERKRKHAPPLRY